MHLKTLFAFAIACVVYGTTLSSHAQFVWNGGGGDDNWTTGANWDGGIAPPSSNTTQIQFAGSTRPTPFVDTNNPWALQSLQFTAGTAAFTLSGNTLSFPQSTTIILNQSSNVQTINNNLLIGTGGTKTITAQSNPIVLNGDIALTPGSISFRGGQSVTVNGLVTGTGALTRTDAGTTFITNNNNSFTGDVAIAHGVFQVASIADAGQPSALGAGNNIILSQGTWSPSDTGTLRYTGPSASSNRNFLMRSNDSSQGSQPLGISGRPTIEVTNPATTLTLNGDFNYASGAFSGIHWRLTGAGNGVINGNITTTEAGLLKDGSGTWTLAGQNTYQGGTTVSQGTLSITNSAALGTGPVTVSSPNNARLLLSGGLTIPNAITFSGTPTPGTPGLDLSSGTSTVTGLLTVNGNARIRSAGGSTLVVAGGLTGSNPSFIAVNANGTIHFTANPIQLGNNTFYTDSGGLTLIDVAGNSWGGTRLISGTLRTGIANALPANTTITMGGASYGSGGSLDLNGFDQTISGITHGTDANPIRYNGTSLTSATPATLTINQNASTSYRGGIKGALALTKGGTGILTLTGEFNSTADHHTGDTRVIGGTLALANTDILQNSTLDTGPSGPQQVTFTVPGSNTYLLGGLKGEDALDFGANHLNVGANHQSNDFAGVLSGSGNFTKEGTGTQTLSGANTYTGDTMVTGGSLLVNGSIIPSSGSSNLTVGSGAAVGGTGVIGSSANPVDISILAGGTMAPGNSPGVLTVNGDMLFGAGSFFDVDLAIGGFAGAGNGTIGTDRLVVNGGVSLDGALLTGSWGGNNANMFNGTPSASNQLWLIDNDGTDPITGTFANASPAPGFAGLFNDPSANPHLTTIDGQLFALFYDADLGSQSLSGGNDLLLMAIPEPSRALLLVLAGLGLIARRRRSPARQPCA